MVFVKPKDPYVADLLYSYALIEANLSTVETGIKLLQMAREYGFPDEALLRVHQKRYEFLMTIALIKWWAMVLLGIVIIILFLYYCYRKKWFFLSRRAFEAHQAARSLARPQ